MVNGTERTARIIFTVVVVTVIGVVLLALPPNLSGPVFLALVIGSLGVAIMWSSLDSRLSTSPIWESLEQFYSSFVAKFGEFSSACRQLLRDHRFRRFAFGAALIGFSHYLMAQEPPFFVTFALSETLNKFFHVGIPNTDNVILGIICLVVGAYYVGRVLMPHARDESITCSESHDLPSPVKVLRLQAVPLGIAVVLFAFLLRQLAIGDSSLWLVGIWIIILLLLLKIGFAYDKHASILLRPRLRRLDLLCILLIFIGGLLIGTHQLDTIPNSIIKDEGSFLDNAQSVARGDNDKIFFGPGVYTFPYPSTIYQGVILKIFGNSLWSWRFSSVLAGMLAVIPTYLLTLKLFNRRVAILASLIMVVTPYFIDYERLGYNNSQAILPVVLAIYLFVMALQSESIFYFVLSGIITGLGFYTFLAARLGLVIIAIFTVFIVISKIRGAQKSGDRRLLHSPGILKLLFFSAIFIIAVAVTVLPYYVAVSVKEPGTLNAKIFETLFPNTGYASDLYNKTELYQNFPPMQIENQTFFFQPDLYVALLGRGLIRTLLAPQMVLGLNNSIFMASPLAGALAAPFYFIGLIVALSQIRQKRYLVLIIWLLSGMLLLSIIETYPPRQTLMIPLIPALAILSALGLTACADFISTIFPMQNTGIASVLLLLVLVGIMVTGLHNYFVEVPEQYTPDFENIMDFNDLQLQNPRNVIYITDDARQKDFIPFLTQHLPNKATFHTVYYSQLILSSYGINPDRSTERKFILGNYPIDLNQHYTFYFSYPDKTAMTAYLESNFPENNIDPIVYKDSQQRVVLLSWSNSGEAQ